MAGRRSDFILDELICFLSNPLFQVPVLSFMESKCLIFDPHVEDSQSYREIHEEYKKLVDLLLEGFRADTGLTHDQIIQAMKDLNSKPDLRDLFQVLLEQVLATEDYPVFVQIMAQKNLELQHQALLLISQMMGGVLPESLIKEVSVKAGTGQHGPRDEEKVLMAVLVQSREEFEKEKKESQREAEELHMIIGLSQSESDRIQESLRHEQDKLSETIQRSLQLSEQPTVEHRTKPSLSKSASIPAPASYHQPKRQASTTVAPKSMASHVAGGLEKIPETNLTSAEAAAAWLKNAETEVHSSDAHSRAVQAAVANMSGLTEEEYKKRAEYLKQQRDKLMEMKRKEREKQLLSAEKSQPQRPASARAARAALQQGGAPQKPPRLSPEEEKKLAMRRAIAERIKSELMGKK
ncbi:unnamed protein product [Candidula unifasciata]|uniref:Cilia- and flagella-associated protein 36 n=1 Tax=Candidula unifasciata TaxID=100452 RepID=A0A8S3ZSZ8_9EUPU|nr:unnamed protein product [Candidula unifasciata]